MERITINKLKNHLNEEIRSTFLVTEKELKEGMRGEYLRLRLADRYGSLNAYIWDNAAIFDKRCQIDDIVKVYGRVKDYKGQLQLAILDIETLPDLSEMELSEYLQTTKKDLTKLADEFFEFVESLRDIYLKELLKSIFEDHEFFLRFSRSPAAKSWHHNYQGGLLEHTVSVAKICEFTAQNYPIDRDLLIAGALLHDVGKVGEYHGKKVFEFTDIGRLLGHLALGDEIITKKAALINAFPSDLLMKLRHLVLSHHGEPEKGAIKVPQTLEAVVLHHADNLDAQTVGVQQIIEGAVGDTSEWSEYDRLNNRYYFLK
jgi:3'-5' exoribonuclease